MEIKAQKVDQAFSLSYNKGTNLQCSAQRNGYYIFCKDEAYVSSMFCVKMMKSMSLI